MTSPQQNFVISASTLRRCIHLVMKNLSLPINILDHIVSGSADKKQSIIGIIKRPASQFSPPVILMIYMEVKSQVSHIVPALVPLPPTHPFIPSPSLQASSICIPHHVPHILASKTPAPLIWPVPSDFTPAFHLPSISFFSSSFGFRLEIHLCISRLTMYTICFSRKIFFLDLINYYIMNDFASWSAYPFPDMVTSITYIAVSIKNNYFSLNYWCLCSSFAMTSTGVVSISGM